MGKPTRKPENRTLVMGILNVTPDSFSDGGLYSSTSAALDRVAAMLDEGADSIDVGGESTRPGSLAVSAEEEIARVVPVIEAIRARFGRKITISVDTNKSAVAAAALKAGASMVNSLGGFASDPALAAVVAKAACPIVIYHIKGEPRTMQTGKIFYKDVVAEVNDFFKAQMKIGAKAGVRKEQYILDPGIGFGKSVEHNLTIVKSYRAFAKWKRPLMVGASRKSHLGLALKERLKLEEVPLPRERVEAGLAEAGVAVQGGASIVRTHDVRATKKFLAVLDALRD